MRLKHTTDPVPPGIGVGEEQIHIGSGLRTQDIGCTLSSVVGTYRSWNAFTVGTSITISAGIIAAANAGTFTSIRPGTWVGSLPVPMTPSITLSFFHLANTAFKVQFRVLGEDQFGQAIEEITPMFSLSNFDVTAPSTTVHYAITMSKVFSYVSDVQIRGQDLESTIVPQYSMGWYNFPDWTGALLATALDPLTTTVTSNINTLGSHENWGIGTPLRVSPYGFDPAATVAATGTLTLGGAGAANGDTVTIDGVVYTFRTALTVAVPNEVLIGGSIAASVQNLYDAINGSGTRGTQYTAITPQHPTVRASSVTATTVVVASRVLGVNGNAIATTETGGNMSWGSATLTGGLDSAKSRHPEILGASGVLLREKTTPTVINNAKKWPVWGTPGALTGLVLGRSAPAATAAAGSGGLVYTNNHWQGTAHKIGFRTSDAWATAPFEVNGSSTRASNTPTSTAELGEDEFEWCFTIRSSLGTQRDAVAGASSYVR